MDVATIHDSLANGQRTQMVEQITEYGDYDFWADYKAFLRNRYHGSVQEMSLSWNYFTDAVISTARIRGR